MEHWHYLYAGLQVDSHLEIPEWDGFESTGVSKQADVHIRLGNVSEGVSECPKDVPFIHSSEYCFCVPDVASYRVRQGREISVSPVPGAGGQEVRLYLLGSAWGVLCYQRSQLALHASVVEVGTQAVMFCGASGTGKSCTAAWLVRQGYPLVSDDLCCFDLLPDGTPLVHASARRLKLWRDAIEALNWKEQELVRDHVRLDKFHLVDLPGLRKSGRSEPLRLRAIYLLNWGENNLVRLTGLEALRRFVRAATYRGDLLEKMGLPASHWQRCIQLIQHTPVYEFSRPRDWTALETAMNLTFGHEFGQKEETFYTG